MIATDNTQVLPGTASYNSPDAARLTEKFNSCADSYLRYLGTYLK